MFKLATSEFHDDNSRIGMIVSVVVGVIVGIGVLLALLLYVKIRPRKRMVGAVEGSLLVFGFRV